VTDLPRTGALVHRPAPVVLARSAPVPALFAAVPAQPAAVAALTAAAARPVHAYLLVGPPGTGKRAAATAFAAALLCPAGGDGTCDTCRRVEAGIHPDVIVVEREGPAMTIDKAREVARLSARSPVEGDRKILVLTDFHLVSAAGPALLKTVEEPPPSTVFVILAEYVPPELVTIASRCVRVDFQPVPAAAVVEILVAEGVDPAQARALAKVAGGRLDRARLLAADPQFEARRRAWGSVPDRLDGFGATAASLADELVGLLESSVEPLRARQAEEAAALEERNTRAASVNGKVGRAARVDLNAGVREMEERHKREVRRQRTDELRTGLAILAGAYRERLAEPRTRAGAVAAIDAIDELGRNLVRNPGETLALQALLVALGQA
jgi:DNA polymerase-3 subunit delta'